jgi:DNA primase
MTKRCFSSSQLYAMRNEINIEMLIEKTLGIPSQVTKGCFRFLCPLCNGFDTAVNPKTNLARCFRCEKNFNTIDLVMLIRKTNFVQSVKFLQSTIKKILTAKILAMQRRYPAATPRVGARLNSKHRQQNQTAIRAALERFLTMSCP